MSDQPTGDGLLRFEAALTISGSTGRAITFPAGENVADYIERLLNERGQVEQKLSDALVALEREREKRSLWEHKYDTLNEGLHDLIADPRLATRDEIVAYIKRELLGVEW